MKEKLIDKLQEHKTAPVDTSPHLIVEARAGTGKTTTLIEGLKYVLTDQCSDLQPSLQQLAIWAEMQRSRGKVRSVCFVAFNRAIADELKQRVPKGCDAMTMHSMGLRALRDRFPGDEDLKLNAFRVRDIIVGMLNYARYGRISRFSKPSDKFLPENERDSVRAVERLVSLCKMNLTGFNLQNYLPEENERRYWNKRLSELASNYDVDLNSNEREVFDLVPRVLERCKDVARDGCIDFDDMIWLPVVLDLDVYRYDLLLVDEAQDLNRCQQQLALKAGRRLILVGDPKQSIYSFAGADGESMERMHSLLGGNVGSPDCGKRGCITLPLTVTRRCGRAIVEEARKIVPDFEAHESCCDGKITYRSFGNEDDLPVQGLPSCNEETDYRLFVETGDMVLCRINAPLVSECFEFIKQGRKATIRGRKIGQGLVSLVRKVRKKGSRETSSLVTLQHELSDWLRSERCKENAKLHPSENRLINIQDRYDCLMYFVDGAASVQDVISHIQSIFSDDAGEGILLSSIHKAKGLESSRVFILMPEGAGIPHPMAHTPQQREEEMNCLYVAITRAREELCYVT